MKRQFWFASLQLNSFSNELFFNELHAVLSHTTYTTSSRIAIQSLVHHRFFLEIDQYRYIKILHNTIDPIIRLRVEKNSHKLYSYSPETRAKVSFWAEFWYRKRWSIARKGLLLLSQTTYTPSSRVAIQSLVHHLFFLEMDQYRYIKILHNAIDLIIRLRVKEFPQALQFPRASC